MPDVSLPLLERSDLVQVSLSHAPVRSLIPNRKPHAGEQYRFHFDMAKCIGCKCCVVACNEQNGNPAELNWRRVGEVEGGVYPLAQRWHLSMGCNHCVEPSCLTGCPVQAYTKDTLTGIVDHSADICIGCQYCTWNCSYQVPQYNPARGVVGKCDMCHGRLSQGSQPACVNACPEGAIAIEIVDIAKWRLDHGAADAPGLPSAGDSISTTRITLPEHIAVARVDLERIRPEHAHASLVFLLVMSQMATGAMGALAWQLATTSSMPIWMRAVPLVAVMIALAAAPLHLGRPIHAPRAVRGWRTSWLSREVIAFGLFGAASGLAFLLATPLAAAVACLTGAAGAWCSARIYMVKARPAWNSLYTPAEFFLTALALGPALFGFGAFAAAALAAQLLLSVARLRQWRASSAIELLSSAALTDGQLRRTWHLRLALAAIAIVLLPFSPMAGFCFALISEFAGRTLFFQTVAPKSMAAAFLTPGGRG
jgi:formate dehydrogenase iron-sulfur subunit